VSQFADAEQRESAVRADDDGGPFVHACYCGKWGFFGYDVTLMKGRKKLGIANRATLAVMVSSDAGTWDQRR